MIVEARDVSLRRLDLGPRRDDSDELYGILFRANFYVVGSIVESLDEAPLPDGPHDSLQPASPPAWSWLKQNDLIPD